MQESYFSASNPPRNVHRRTTKRVPKTATKPWYRRWWAIALGIFLVVGLIGSFFADNDEDEEAEEAAEAQEAEKQDTDDEDETAQEDEAAEEEVTQEEDEAVEEPDIPDELPEGLDAQIERMTDLDGFDDSSIFANGPEHDATLEQLTVYVSLEVEMGLFASTTCHEAQNLAIDALEFMRDEVDEEYDVFQMELFMRGEASATGDRPIIGIATTVYDRETVEAIDSDSVSTTNVWAARDDGSVDPECQ